MLNGQNFHLYPVNFGYKCLRFSIKALETVGDLAPRDGIRAAWQIMRAATAAPNAYMHKWQAGDTMVWGECQPALFVLLPCVRCPRPRT